MRSLWNPKWSPIDPMNSQGAKEVTNEVIWGSNDITSRPNVVTWKSIDVTWRPNEVTWRPNDITLGPKEVI